MVHKVDFAASTALPVVAMSFKQNDFRIIGTVGILANDNVVVARRNAGIVNVADLKGKRVGTGENIMPHYMLDLLLRKHGLQCNEALVTFAPQSKLVEDLSKGELDAATLLGKYISQASKNLNTNAVIFSDKTLFEIKTYVMVHESFTRKRPQAIDKFLRGCLRAERHIAAHPDESMKIVSRRLKMDIAVVQQAWPNCHFAVEFHQAMLNDIESKARWQIDRCLTTSKTMPNYLNFLNYQALEKIAPQRVTIIH
jgi:NitT/TauT family transport system substrate-binding protein